MYNHKMIKHIKVSENENHDDLTEIPVEPDGSILMSSLKSQFPHARGLKFKIKGKWRG